MILRRPFFWIILLIAAGFIYAPLHGNNVSLREDLILVAIAIILASNLNLMIGYTGYVNFGHIVFYGLGGYVGLYLTTVRSWNLVLSALMAGVVVSLCAFLFGLAILRLRGAYFALATIGILQAVQAFVSNFDPWGRSTGMYLSFNSYQSLGGARHALWITYFLIIAVMALSMIVSLVIKNSKFGLGLFAIREDEDAAVVLGVNATVYKAIIYSVSAFLPAVAGALMFFKNGMIDPSIAFEYMLSLEGIVMLMLGGQGSVIGAALGGALYERLRSYLLTSPILSNFHLVIAGGLLLIVVLVRAWRLDWLGVSPGTAGAQGDRMSTLLEVRGVSKRFGGLVAVSDVSFSIDEGEIVGLIGPNGAGKTTLFNVVNGVYKANQGTITFAGKDITRLFAGSGGSPRIGAHPPDREALERPYGAGQRHGGCLLRPRISRYGRRTQGSFRSAAAGWIGGPREHDGALADHRRQEALGNSAGAGGETQAPVAGRGAGGT